MVLKHARYQKAILITVDLYHREANPSRLAATAVFARGAVSPVSRRTIQHQAEKMGDDDGS